MKFEDFAENALYNMIKTPVPKARFKSRNYNYSISFENTRFNWYSSPANDYILSIAGANVDFFCTTRHGDYLKSSMLPSRHFTDMKEFVKATILGSIEDYEQIFKQYKIDEKSIKPVEKNSLLGLTFEGTTSSTNGKQCFTYDSCFYFEDKVLSLITIVPESAPREIFWEAKQIIDSVELVSGL